MYLNCNTSILEHSDDVQSNLEQRTRHSYLPYLQNYVFCSHNLRVSRTDGIRQVLKHGYISFLQLEYHMKLILMQPEYLFPLEIQRYNLKIFWPRMSLIHQQSAQG